MKLTKFSKDLYNWIERNKDESKNKGLIPVKRGCMANGLCLCTGECQEIVGYREPLPSERFNEPIKKL